MAVGVEQVADIDRRLFGDILEGENNFGVGLLPENLDYNDVKGLRLEAIQKLNDIKPSSIGHASRIAGVSPADISVLLIYLEQLKGKNIDE